MVDLDLMDTIRPALLDGEQVVWAARPDPRRHFCAADVLLIPFFGVLAVVGIAGMFATNFGAIGVVYSLVFVAFSLYLSVGRLFVRRWRKQRTIYALTDRRALILTHNRRRGASTVAMRLDLLPTYEYVRRAGGAGDIIFGSSSGMSRALANTAMPWWYNFSRAPAPPAFYDLADAEAPNQILVRNRPDL